MTTLLILFGALVILGSGPKSVDMGYAASVEEGSANSGAAEDVIPLGSFDDPPEVLWRTLAGLDYSTGEIGEELAPFVGKTVKIPGFMVPLEDWAEQVSEFLLVPYVGACVHTPPPPPNQLVYILMEDAKKVAVSFWSPVWIHGTLEVEETTNVYGPVSFRMAGTTVEPYE
ncbi:MAG: DUF3299 domain-containing protein [Gemmatimonadetes bacterium]|nr:DUF3299 domain-containing protein [Gemmatimonadota bacterium]